MIHRATVKEAEEFGGAILVQGGTEDHLHVIIALPPTIALSTAVGRLKAVSCRTVRQELRQLEFEWQCGYFAHTLNAHDFSDAYVYVRDQKKRHARRELQRELEPDD